jgi:glycosyltransferase involved in cell wall biosynthesis
MTYLGFDISSVPKLSTDELLKTVKVLFFNRNTHDSVEKVLRFQKRHGFKIVMDLDDYWHLNVNHPLYPTWIKNKMGETIVDWLKHANAITVTTARLADKVRAYNKNVHVIPNGLPFGDGQFNDFKKESDHTRFIYTGGESHVRDIDILKIPFTKLINVPNARFILAGYSPKNPKVWDKMEKVFKLTKNYRMVNYMPLNSYMNVYQDADVSVVPLEHNIFTPYKSNIKFQEAGCKNIPIICSSVPPYSDEPDKSKVMYASNTREWLHWLKYCHDNKNFVKEKGLELGEYVRENYDLRKMNEYRKQLFESLMN